MPTTPNPLIYKPESNYIENGMSITMSMNYRLNRAPLCFVDLPPVDLVPAGPVVQTATAILNAGFVPIDIGLIGMVKIPTNNRRYIVSINPDTNWIVISPAQYKQSLKRSYTVDGHGISVGNYKQNTGSKSLYISISGSDNEEKFPLYQTTVGNVSSITTHSLNIFEPDMVSNNIDRLNDDDSISNSSPLFFIRLDFNAPIRLPIAMIKNQGYTGYQAKMTGIFNTSHVYIPLTQ